jgi:hypothetical protein
MLPSILANGGKLNFNPIFYSTKNKVYILIHQLERVVSPNPAVDTVKSNDSDKTLSGSSDSIGTAYRLDSQDSTTSVEGISPTLVLLFISTREMENIGRGSTLGILSLFSQRGVNAGRHGCKTKE